MGTEGTPHTSNGLQGLYWEGEEHLQLTDGHWARNVTVPRGEEYRGGEPVRVWEGSSPPKKALMGEHPGAGVGELYTQGWQNTGGLEAKYSQSKVNSIPGHSCPGLLRTGRQGPQKAGRALEEQPSLSS